MEGDRLRVLYYLGILNKQTRNANQKCQMNPFQVSMNYYLYMDLKNHSDPMGMHIYGYLFGSLFTSEREVRVGLNCAC